jgi:hypothetical protein
MDDLPSLDPNFAGPAASSATPKRNLDAGVLETIQRVLGCPDVDRLPGVLANRYERRIALPGARTEALDVMRLGSTSTTRTGRPTKPCSPCCITPQTCSVPLSGRRDETASSFA